MTPQAILNPDNRPYLLCAVSAGLLISALGFQYIGGLVPCTLCIWQRIPHTLIFTLAAGFFLVKTTSQKALLCAIASIIMLTSTLLAFYHVGVEIGVWKGLTSCGMIDFSGTVAQVEARIAQGSPDCGTVAWRFLGHSMAAWNLFFSAVLTGAWIGMTHHFLKTHSE